MVFDWSQLTLYHGLIILGELLAISALMHMLYQRRTPTSMIAWLLAIILLPYLAVPLYFILGSRKRHIKQDKSTFYMREHPQALKQANAIDGILQSNGIPGATANNRFEFFQDGVDAYKILMHQIENAQESIYFSTYVFKHDDVTETIIQALLVKLKHGVKVKLLIDSLGSWQLYFLQYPLRELRQAGAEILFFMPILRMPLRNYINLRNHRKIYLFDQTTVLTGGMNLSNEYLGPEPDPQRWNDLLFLAEGPAVYHYAQIFAADWAYASHTEVMALNKADSGNGNAYMQVVPSGPDVRGDALFEAIVSAVYSVKKRVWVVTPYFVPDASLMQAFIIARHKGVDVKLITPRESNHLIADLTRSSYMRELEEAGVHVALYEGTMLHAKAILFDDLGAMLGSVNIDNRSLLLNYEVISFAYSKKIIHETEVWMQRLLDDSSLNMQPANGLRRLGENLMRVFAPQM